MLSDDFQKKRIAVFKAALDPSPATGRIDLGTIRKYGFEGIPDDSGLRSIYWKLLLGYLPDEKVLWYDTVVEERKQYKELKEYFLVPLRAELEKKASNRGYRSEDLDRLTVIKNDVHRTLPDLHFFSVGGSGTKHGEALVNILFVYSKTNTAIQYVQGMNEILAPILYVLCTDPPCETLEDVEADAFFCFSHLMAEIDGCFCRRLDESMLDTHSTIGKYNALLATLDPELFVHFKQVGLDPRFYSLRWLSLLFSQELQLPDTLRLWDSLFADERRFEFLLFFACAMVISHKQELMRSGFAEALELLQNYPPLDVVEVIKFAKHMRVTTPREKLLPRALEATVIALSAPSVTISSAASVAAAVSATTTATTATTAAAAAGGGGSSSSGSGSSLSSSGSSQSSLHSSKKSESSSIFRRLLNKN